MGMELKIINVNTAITTTPSDIPKSEITKPTLEDIFKLPLFRDSPTTKLSLYRKEDGQIIYIQKSSRHKSKSKKPEEQLNKIIENTKNKLTIQQQE
jgi:hypothetical protein